MSQITASPTVKPPPDPFYGDSYVRGLDPWHRDAFPDDLQDQAPNQASPRESGWFLQDAWGNDIVYYPDGSVFKVPTQTILPTTP